MMKSQTEVSLPTVPTKPAPLKPAILPSLGTTQALSISARPRTERTVKDRNTTRARQTSLKTAGLINDSH